MLVDGINQSNGNTKPDHADAVYGVSAKLDNPTTDQLFNINSVKLQVFGSYGDVGRNTTISPLPGSAVTNW